MYIARVFEKITDERAVYKEKLLEIPTPEFIVLYNGLKPYPAEKILRLSDAYTGTDESIEKFGSLDLTVRVLNINPGYNDELTRKSETLQNYTAFIERVRASQRGGSSLRDAVNEAINWGKSQSVLRSFLTEHKTEVDSMLMTEFNIDIAKEVWQEEAREDIREELEEEIAKVKAENAEVKAESAGVKAELAKVKAEKERLQALVAELQGIDNT